MAINLFDFSQNQSKIPNATGYLSQFQKKEAPVLNFGAPKSGTVSFKDSWIAQVKPKPTAPSSGGFSLVPKASASWNEDIVKQALSDIKAWMPINEFENYYPELKEQKQIFEQYISDINAWMPESEWIKLYPELFWPTQPVQQEKWYYWAAKDDLKQWIMEIPAWVVWLYDRAKDRFSKAVTEWQVSDNRFTQFVEWWIAWWLATTWTLFDVAFTPLINLLEIVAPEKVEDVVRWWVEKLAPAIQEASDKIEQFANTSPEARSLVNRSKLLLEWAVLPWAWTVATQWAVKVAEATWKWVLKWTQKVWNLASSQARKIDTRALEQIRKDAEEIALPTIKELWKRQKWEIFWDVIETWDWFFKKQELVRNPQDSLSIEETTRLINEGKLSKSMSEIQKRNVIEAEIENLSKTLDSNLRSTNVNISKSDMNKLFDDLSNQIIDNPVIVWDAETSLRKLLPTLKSKLDKEIYYPEDILQLRKDFDNAIRKAKWEWVFDPKTESAFTTAIRDFRQWLNNKVAELVPDANVKQILDKQSSLYNVSKTLSDRFSWQANSLIWRVLNKVQWVTWVPRTEIIELTTALWLAGIISPLIAPVSWVIAAGYLWKKWIQYLTRPENKRKVARILRKFDEAINNNPSKASEIKKSKQEFENIFLNKNNGNNSDNIIPRTILTSKEWWDLKSPVLPKRKSILSPKETELIKKNKTILTPTKTQLETTLKWATTSNINEITQSVAKTLKTTKTAEIKAIIQRYLKEFWNDFKNKIWDMIEEIIKKTK